ncbi:chemotaxis protein CheA [Aquibacillus koreensis]|uniref:Chemotaxis protein CheA n=1 Tax=Aquibacillus koreensis TaxID=279446 RepID=A0A9X3WNI3_9BACI|nr:chemotaxis protein CheA [Aquibacillus koreensis]MCT2534543.1 chemotaxis protein CheA [Aquibacillus koreensis]MDC3421863.1 chemotaxis protein CheA [Aquibacillus koreensis]
MEMNEYLEVFIEESKEHIQRLNDHLLILEKDPTNMDTVSEIFRSAHTLKGMSATMGYQDLANLTHKMENVLDAVRNQKLVIDSNILDVVLDAVDQLEAMVVDIASGGDGSRDVESLVSQLQAIENGEDTPVVETKKTGEHLSQTSSSSESAFDKLDEFEMTVLQESEEKGFSNLEVHVKLQEGCLLKAARVYMVFEVLEQVGEVIKSSPSVPDLEEEKFDFDFTVLLVTKETEDHINKRIMKVSEVESVEIKAFSVTDSSSRTTDTPKEGSDKQTGTEVAATKEKTNDKIQNNSKAVVSNKTIRVNIDRLDGLMNLFEELVIDRGRLEQIAANLKHGELQETVERMTRISGDLQTIILNMRMVPIESVFNRFPRMIRQLAKDLGKQINLDIVGADTELDRTVIDEIGDPLVHLIRNALDHGVESPEDRIAKGKPAEGNLELKAYHSGNHVFIEISDDGGGINREKVLNKAVSSGVISSDQADMLTDNQVYQLIMESGFSTADKISDVSGRGVGLDVVKNTIESLGGSISIDSQFGKGTVFSIQLPLTLSIISVLLVEVQKEKYAIPLSSIIETAIVSKSEILNAHNKKVIDFRGKVVPLVSLKNVFDVPETMEDDELSSVVIIRKGDKMAGLIVDTFIGQQEVVLKSLGDYLTGVFAISGATILGDGQVALIIDPNALIK